MEVGLLMKALPNVKKMMRTAVIPPAYTLLLPLTNTAMTWTMISNVIHPPFTLWPRLASPLPLPLMLSHFR